MPNDDFIFTKIFIEVGSGQVITFGESFGSDTKKIESVLCCKSALYEYFLVIVCPPTGLFKRKL